MHKIALPLSCLVFACHGQQEDVSIEKQIHWARQVSVPTKACAMLLLGLNPASAFASSAGGASFACSPNLASGRTSVGDARTRPRHCWPVMRTVIQQAPQEIVLDEDDDPPLLWEASEYFRERNVQLHKVSTATRGSRSLSRVPVRANEDGDGAVIGLFKEGTHTVVPWRFDERCHVPHHPSINKAISVVEKELGAFRKLSAYDEDSGEGTLRYLQIALERSTRRVQLTLVGNVGTIDDDPALTAFAERLWARYGGASTEQSLSLHSIWVNLNPTALNNILSYEEGAWLLLHADEDEEKAGDGTGDSTAHTAAFQGNLVETLPSGATVVLPPYVFRQANLEGFDGIVAQLRDAVPHGSRVVEWYSGVGLLGLSVAPDAEWVRCSDINPPHDAFEASKALLEPQVQPRVSYRVGGAADCLEDARGADVAIVDPPRKGLDDRLVKELCSHRRESPCADLETLVYVSCGFYALARDADNLLKSGRWCIRDAEAWAHVLFAGANHIETVVVFERCEAEEDTHKPAIMGARAKKFARKRKIRSRLRGK